MEPVEIPAGELSFVAIRASGPGGQNVNKVSSAVQLRFDLQGSSVLTAPAKQRLRVLAGRRVTDDGALLIIARTHRSQDHNRRDALERLQALIAQALVEPRRRRATKPTKASKERRLQSKRREQGVKRMRRAPSRED